MALIDFGASHCPICNAVINVADEIVTTSHFIVDEADPLWQFSDAAIHRTCFLRWQHREAFVARYNAEVGSRTWGDGSYHEMQSDGSILSKRREGRG